MAVAATGFFDGVHLGHREVLGRMCAIARSRGEESLVVSFWPHPRSVLQQDADKLRLLTTLDEKRALCRDCGVVVAGNRIGRKIGFPTANMQLYEPLKLVPANGVYAVRVEVLGQRYGGVCNIGMRPTVGLGGGRTIETHILGFDQDIYGLDLSIEFCGRLRDERKFDSLDSLRRQLALDCQKAVEIIGA